uniref:FBD domain-containing protein n=1 Tax=Leersia perrieri TaxID=77586 RepID=A0A0D9XQ77_9ORYZ
MTYCLFYSNYRMLLDFPNLVSFYFYKNLGKTPLLETMPLLEIATVRLDYYCDDKCTYGRYDDCGDAECKGCHDYYAPDDYDCVFLEGLTEATDLELLAYSEVYLFNRDLKWCPTFSKLKILILSSWFVAPDLSALTWFLQHAPLLERLTLKLSKVPNNLVETDGSYNPLEQSAASSHLEVVEIKCKYVDEIVLKVLKVLNANGIPLEKISIQCSGCDLVSFYFDKNVGRTPRLDRMPSLAAASVRLGYDCDDQCQNSCYSECIDAECMGCRYYGGDDSCVFLEGLTEATDLKLLTFPTVYVFNRDLEWCPPFSKLKTLVLKAWFVAPNFSPLLWFLQHAPLLEKLTLVLSKLPKYISNTYGSYSPWEQSFVPARHLQVVEIECKDVDGTIRNILKILNASGVSVVLPRN